MSSYKLGEIVISTAGRDQDKYYIVVDILDERYIELVDGDTRKLDNSKKKNIKHIDRTGYVAEELSHWLEDGKRIRNEDLKRVVRDYEQNKEA